MKKFILLLIMFWAYQWSFAQTLTWNGSVDNDWNNANNWTPATVPTATADVVINNGAIVNQPVLNGSTTIASIVMSGGSILTINGATLTVSGAKNSSFSNATIATTMGGSLDFNISSGNTLTFGSSFTCNVSITGQAGRILFNGSTFNGSINLTKTGTVAYSNGNNTFNAPITLTNQSNSIWRLANTTPDNFNAACIFINSGTSQFQIAFNGATTITADFTLQATSGTISIGGPSANVSLNNLLDLTGMSASVARFENCTFQQNPLNLTLGTNGTFQSINSTFSNAFTLNTSRFLSQGSTYNGIFTLNRNNNTIADNSVGGNTFNSDVFVTLNGTFGGRFASTNGDNFNANLTVTNNSTASFVFGFTGTNNILGNLNIINNTSSILTFGNTGTINFNGTISAQNTSTGTVRFSQSTGCTANFNNSITFDNVGGGSFRLGNGGGVSNWGMGVLLLANNFTNGGVLQLSNITQNDNTITQNINLANATLTISGCIWQATVNFIAPNLTTANTTYHNTTYIEKNGAGTSSSTGGNVFNGVTNIVNSGTGTFRMANTTGDDFNNSVTFTRTNGSLVPVYGASSTFSGDVAVNSATTINFNGLASSNAVFDGNGNQNLSATSGDNLFRNVTLNNPNLKLVLQNTMTINNVGSLTFNNGQLVLNQRILRINNPVGSAITRTNGGIVSESSDHNGRVEWAIGNNTDNHEFPFVNNSNEYVVFSIMLTSGDIGTLQVSTYGTPSNNLPYPTGVTELLNNSAQNNSLYTVDRFFVATPSGTTYTANASFGYGDSEILAPNLLNENTLKAQRWNGTLWEDPIGSVNTALNRVDVTGITQFSPWTIADASEPLPVQFLNFDALVNGMVVNLNWTTASEKNNSYFSIERSVDGTNFEAIGKVSGIGNSNVPNSYQFTDFNPAKGISYYRIKQVDFNGAETYSQVRSVRFDQLIGWISYYPNPANDKISFNLQQTNASQVFINISNSLGQMVWEKVLYPQTQNEYSLDISNWTKGVYIVNIKIEGKTTSSKLVVQ